MNLDQDDFADADESQNTDDSNVHNLPLEVYKGIVREIFQPIDFILSTSDNEGIVSTLLSKLEELLDYYSITDYSSILRFLDLKDIHLEQRFRSDGSNKRGKFAMTQAPGPKRVISSLRINFAKEHNLSQKRVSSNGNNVTAPKLDPLSRVEAEIKREKSMLTGVSGHLYEVALRRIERLEIKRELFMQIASKAKPSDEA